MKTIEELESIIYEKKDDIIEMAINNICDIQDVIVYINIFTGELCCGAYTQGTTEHQNFYDEHISIYCIEQGSLDNIETDDVLCYFDSEKEKYMMMSENCNNSTNEKIEITEKEYYNELLEVIRYYFYEDFDEILEGFQYEYSEKNKKNYN